MIDLLAQYQPQIADLCRRFAVNRLELFGSAARGDFNLAVSDFDFFVEFQNLTAGNPSDQYFGLLHGLEDLLGRKIDLVERGSGENRYFMEVAEKHRDLLYAA